MENVNGNVRVDRQTFYYIYKIHFLKGFPSGRYYIGKRTYFGKDISSDNYTGSGTFCFAYFKKYGAIEGETYIKEILEINPSQEVNSQREDYWVGTKYKDDDLCMNLVKGGFGSSDHTVNCYVQEPYKKRINQYNLDGTFVKTWNGVREAARELGINRSGIQSCLSGKKPSAFNYIWKYYEGTTENIEPHFSINPIDQYNQQGELINTFKSSGEAEKKTGIKSGSITKVCEGKRVRAGGFIWRYSGDSFDKYRTENKESSRVYEKKDRPIKQLDKQENLIKIWNRVSEAAEKLHIVENSIYCVAKGTRKTAGGFKWEWLDENDKNNEELNNASCA